MTKLSVLDLAPISEGSDAAQALAHSVDLARHAERLGYERFWLAEHHNMVGIASAATAVVIGHVAGATSTIRVGAGGIMLPNHAPLMVAEAFGTLGTLYPGRIDLGLGRAPGTDQPTARALRRAMVGDEGRFPQDVMELLHYFEPAAPDQAVRAIPGAGVDVPVWILGSSTFGAQLAAHLGLPYAFASHFAPTDLEAALRVYRETFQPSKYLSEPYAVAGLNVVAADTDQEASVLFSSLQQMFVNLRTGNPGKLPAPVAGYEDTLDWQGKAVLRQALSASVVGSPDTVRTGLAAFIERTGVDEVIIASAIHDHGARLRSYEIAAQANNKTHRQSA